MKSKILEKLGNNSTDVRVITVNESKNELIGVYTFKNDVYILSDGSDIPFDQLNDSLQKIIVSKIESGDYEIDNTFQG